MEFNKNKINKMNNKINHALKNNITGLCFSNPNKLDLLLKNIKIENIRIDFVNYAPSFPKYWKDN